MTPRNDEWTEYITCFVCGKDIHCTSSIHGLCCITCKAEADSMTRDRFEAICRELDRDIEKGTKP